jgi:hypothetical protein
MSKAHLATLRPLGSLKLDSLGVRIILQEVSIWNITQRP